MGSPSPPEALPALSPTLKKWIVLAALLGYLILIFYLLYVIGVGEIVSVLGKVNFGVYAISITCVIVSLTFHTLVWFQLLNSLSINITIRRTYTLYWVGIFVDNLIPGGWSGDLFKAYLLNRDPSVESGKAVASVVAKNMYEAIFNLGNMIFGMVLLIYNYTFEGSLLITLGGVMLLLTLPLAILLLASFRPSGAKSIVSSFFRILNFFGRKSWRLDSLRGKVEKALEDYHEGMETLLENPRMLVRPMILSFIAWGFEVIALLFVFASLGQFIPLDKVIIVRSIAGNVESQGYAFVGFAQVITSELYRALGVPFVIGASVALLGGAVIFWLKTGISYAAFHHTVFSPDKSNQETESLAEGPTPESEVEFESSDSNDRDRSSLHRRSSID